MNSHAENTKRIAKNTLMLYVRMLFSMLVSLYTSRVVLNTLGVEDYGIYNVVGGFVAMFSMISNSLSSSVSRFLTFELGRGDIARLREIFSTSLLIHIVLIGLVLILAESIGVWFLNTQMTIPHERLYAANWVFQASALSFMFSLFCVPYNASIVSHEHMNTFAYIGILDVFLRLGIILCIAYIPISFDKLIAYAVLLVIESIVLQGIYLWYCYRHFEECRLRFHFNKQSWQEMGAFAGWNFIGCTAGVLKDHGVNVLLNLFLGPIVNAARGISVSVNVAISGFARNFMAAINPQITKSYASDDRAYMLSLVERGTRFSFYIILLFALPVIFETDFILTLWLKHYPAHSVNFVRLILILSLSDVLSNMLITLQLATGKIRNYQLAVGGMQLMNFPVSYFCLEIGLPPESIFIAAILISLSCLFLRLFLLRGMVGFPVRRFLHNVCCNVCFVMTAASVLPSLLFFNLQEGWTRFLTVVVASLVCVGLSAYFIGCNMAERQFIRSKVLLIKSKLIK